MWCNLFCQWIPTAYIAQRELIHCTLIKIRLIKSALGRFQWPRSLRRGSAVSRLLGMRVRIPTGTWMSVYCECCVLSGTGLCFWLIILSECSYPLWCVWGCCDVSIMRRTSFNRSCCTFGKRVHYYVADEYMDILMQQGLTCVYLIKRYINRNCLF